MLRILLTEKNNIEVISLRNSFMSGMRTAINTVDETTFNWKMI